MDKVTVAFQLLERLQEYHQEEKCRRCECFQGAVTQLEIEHPEALGAALKGLKVEKDSLRN